MSDIEIKSKTWPGALRELQRYYRHNDKITRDIVRWLRYTWLPRCQKNAAERIQVEKDFQSGKLSQNDYEKALSQFEDKFHREELMTDIGLDFLNRNHYASVSTFFRNERELTARVLNRFTEEARWQTMKDNRPLEEIWWEFIQSCLTWGIFPVYADPDDENYHKLLTFADWRFLFERFRKRVSSEIINKTDMIRAIEAGGKGIPISAGLSPLPLPNNPFLTLPAPRVCPDCGMPFSSDKELIDHHRKAHP